MLADAAVDLVSHHRGFALLDARVEGMPRPCQPSIDGHPLRLSSTVLIPSDCLITFSYSRFKYGVPSV